MIIVDDAASVHTLVSPADDELAQRTIPRYLLPLTYISLAVSIIPLVLALLNVARSANHSMPTIISYFLTAPFNIATLLVMWHIIRETVWIPFDISSKKTISFSLFLQFTWLASTIMAGLMAANKSPFGGLCDSAKCQITFTMLTVMDAFQVILLGTIVLIITKDYLKLSASRQNNNSSASSITQVSDTTSTVTKGPRMMTDIPEV